MSGVAEAKLALEGVNIALKLAHALRAMALGGGADKKIIDLTTAIHDAQAHASAAYAREQELAERVRKLEAQLVEMEEWDRTKQRYELREVGDRAFAYVVKEGVDAPGPTHYACAHCFENRKRQILQFTGKYEMGAIHECPQCKLRIAL